MSEELVNSVSEMLQEEWLTGGAKVKISGITQEKLNSLDKILEQAYAEGCEKEIKALCDAQLDGSKESSSSVIALYLSGIIELKDHSLDNRNLLTLIEILERNHKEPLVKSICEEIEKNDPSNKFALRKLAEFYNEEKSPKVWEYYEKILENDHDDPEIPRQLAEYHQKQKDSEKATRYYKNALQRYVDAKNFTGAKEMFSKIIELNATNLSRVYDFLIKEEKRTAKLISEQKAIMLLELLYLHYTEKEDFEQAIVIAKSILEIDSKDRDARKNLVTCYRKIYSAEKKNLESYILTSGLESGFRNVFEAIKDFEKHIAFDKGNFVYHRTWGVGKILGVYGDKLKIVFGGKIGVKDNISLKMAVEVLQPLSEDHFWVKKATKKKSVLAQEVLADVPGTLESIIKSYGNSCDEKHIKSELINSVLNDREWTRFHQEAKKVLEQNKKFVVNPANINEWMVLDHELSNSERLSNKFKAERDFFERINIFLEFVEDEEVNSSSDSFTEMFSYFNSYLKSINNVDAQIVGSYLIIKHVTDMEKFKTVKSGINFTFDELYNEIQNPNEMYGLLESEKIQKDFLDLIQTLPNAESEYIKLFPSILDKTLLERLIKEDSGDNTKKMVIDCFEDYKNNREAVIFFFKEMRKTEWFESIGISYEKQLFTLVNVIDICNKEIDSHVKATENKKIIKNATNLLFEEKTAGGTKNNVIDYIAGNDLDNVTRIYTLLSDVKNLEYDYKNMIHKAILEKYPDFKFQEAEIKKDAPKGLMVTAQKLKDKIAEAENLERVIIPKIQQEVADAKEKGDLKENAEYQSARERASHEGQRLAKLKQQISETVVFDPETVNTNFVSFGTQVTWHNNTDGTDTTYTILGPWESDSDNGILSYQSPLGQNILDAKVGENLKFKIKDREYDLTITSITAAKI